MATRQLDKMIVRRATHADCESVWAINRNIHSGLDANLYTFHQQISMKNYFPYVAEIDGKIVGYSCGEVIDDGEAIVMGQGRVNEEYQGKHVINQITSMLMSIAVSEYPNLRKMLWSSANVSVSEENMRKNPFIKLIDFKYSALFDATSANLKSLCQTKHFSELEEKYKTDAIIAVPKLKALQLLSKEIRFLDFAPEYLVIRWQPYGWHQSTLAEQLKMTNLHVSKSEKTRKIVAFSYDTLGLIDKGLGCTMSFYCQLEDTYKDLFFSHLLYHIKQLAVMQMNERIVLCVLFPREIKKQSVHGFLSSHLNLKSQDRDSLFFASDIPALAAPKSSL